MTEPIHSTDMLPEFVMRNSHGEVVVNFGRDAPTLTLSPAAAIDLADALLRAASSALSSRK